MKTARLFIAAAALSLAPSLALAGTSTANIQSDTSIHNLGSFTGAVTYDNVAETLTFSLDNTSAGKLTGFAFDITGDNTASFDKVKGSAWKDDRNHKGVVIANPYGNYEGGAALHGKFGANGKGIAAGATQSFVFKVSGPTASTLTAADFVSGPGNTQVVASFAGFKHGKTDRVGGILSTGTQNNTTTNTTTNNLAGNPLGNNDPGSNIRPEMLLLLPPPTHAVPLPSAAWSGLMTLAAIGLFPILRRLRAKLA